MVLALVCLPVVPLRAGATAPKPSVDEAPAGAARELKAIYDRQQTLLTIAATKTSQAELEDLHVQFQQLTNDYEDYLGKYPNFSAGYVSYALFLSKPVMDERKRAAALLLKANQLNPDLPVVKNQLGNYLAEEGKPIEALNYYLAAVKLAPKEPLYHYQIGLLITEARDDFLKSGEWTRVTLDKSMQDAFEQAMALSPGNIPYAYRYCESFYDLEHPEWEEALTNWRALEGKVSTELATQTIRLHEANILIKQGKSAEARALLLTVKEAALQAQKQKLTDELEAAANK
jgi:tetratricopeptide (TPR) repeat protein